jgi:N-carbamoylputrescine amidase
MLLGFSRHMLARIVFDQKTTTWLALHVEAFEELGGSAFERVLLLTVENRCCDGQIEAHPVEEGLGDAAEDVLEQEVLDRLVGSAEAFGERPQEQARLALAGPSGTVIDADGTYLGKYRKNHIPHTSGFWEKYFFKPGNLGYPVFETAYARIGVYICYDRHFPEGARLLGLGGAEIVFNPSATSRGLSMYLWNLEQPASAVANEYFIGAINRVGKEPYGDNDFYGSSYFVDPRGQLVGEPASDTDDEVIVRDLDMDMIDEVRKVWAFYRDRRPDAYGPLVAP